MFDCITLVSNCSVIPALLGKYSVDERIVLLNFSILH